MKIRYYIDPKTGSPHVLSHGVSMEEVQEAMDKPGVDRLGSEGTRVVIGQSQAGRYLRIIYVADSETDSAFILTAYKLKGKPLKAYRRHKRRRFR